MLGQDDKISWLHSQLERWLHQGIIDTSHFESISKLYPQPQTKTSRPWALIVFSGIGAVIVGLGVILLFAYNWNEMSKFAKLAVVFGSLALAHLVGISLFIRSERFRGLGEAITVLGTMLFGAGIWLIAQIYHIEEHYPNAFLLWGLGAMLMAWTMPSVIQAIIAAVLFTIWAAMEFAAFGTAMPYVFVLLLLLLPIAYSKYSKVLLAVLLLAFAISAIYVFAAYGNALLVFYVLLCVFAIYTAAAMIQQKFAGFEALSSVYFFPGMAGYFITLYLLTFPDIIKTLLRDEPYYKPHYNTNIFYWLIPLVLMAAGWFFIGWLAIKKDKLKYYSHELFLMPLMPIFLYYCSSSITKYLEWPAIAVFNLVFLAHAAMLMGRGCMNAVLSQATIGSILLIALVIARFTDLFNSLAVRGLIFVVVGILIFSQGFFYIRSKKKKTLQESGK
jgi:uncharacterized membrane protein